jgi:hypothetical protein
MLKLKPMRRRLAFTMIMTTAALMVASSHSVSGATYFLDAVNGNDAQAGTTPGAAWKTLTKFNATTFLPGDTVKFKAGSVWTGAMEVKGSGTSGHPIVVDSFGTANPPAMPRIDGAGVTDAVLVSGVDYWEVNHLEVTNTTATRAASRRSGVRLNSTGTIRHHIQVNGLYVHDVNGDLTKGTNTEGCGIYFDGGAFDSLIIQNCQVVNTDRNGICQNSKSRSTNVIIRGNLLENIGGDCIKLWGTNHGLIEHNVVNGGHMRAMDPAAGIWPFSSDSCTIQFNEVAGMIGCNDGMAYDVDYGTRGTIMQYNYSHDNQGGFMLMCSPSTSYCDRFIIRYNISQNDGISRSAYAYPGAGYREGATFTVGGQATNGLIYNNTIYIGSRLNIPLARVWQWDNGVPSNNLFANNIFYVDTACTASYSFETANTTNAFRHNLYYGTFINQADDAGTAILPMPMDSGAITIRPAFVNPGGAAYGLASCAAYKLQAADSRLVTGLVIAGNGGIDFFGDSVPLFATPYVGADQFTGATNVDFSVPSSGWCSRLTMKVRTFRSQSIAEVLIFMPGTERARLWLVDARGRLLTILFEGVIGGGERRFTVDLVRFAPGVMFAKLSTAGSGFAASLIITGR